MDPSSKGPKERPAPGTRPIAIAPGAGKRLRAEGFEMLEQRLEASLAAGTGMADLEPCVWHCACFLVHGA